MNLVISGHGVSVTPAMRQHATDLMHRLTASFDGIVSATVNFKLSGDKITDKPHGATLQLKVKDMPVIALEHAENCAYKTMSELAAKARRAITTQKGKRQTPRRQRRHEHASAA